MLSFKTGTVLNYNQLRQSAFSFSDIQIWL